MFISFIFPTLPQDYTKDFSPCKQILCIVNLSKYLAFQRTHDAIYFICTWGNLILLLFVKSFQWKFPGADDSYKFCHAIITTTKIILIWFKSFKRAGNISIMQTTKLTKLKKLKTNILLKIETSYQI